MEEIQSIVQLNKKYIKAIIAKYLYEKGGSVSEIGEALGMNNQDVRAAVNAAEGEGEGGDNKVEHSEKIKVLKGAKETVVLNKLVKKGQQQLDDIC